MKIFQNLASKLDKPVTIEYAMEYLRAKGIATGECGSNNLSFKLYDMNWDMYIEEGRFGLRNSFNVGSDINILLSAKNRNVRNNVSAVPIHRYCGFIFQKVSPPI